MAISDETATTMMIKEWREKREEIIEKVTFSLIVRR